MKIYEILKNTENISDERVFAQLNNTQITYKEFKNNIQKLREILLEVGVDKKVKVAILIDNYIEFLIASFAINSLDAVIIPFYTCTGALKLRKQLDYFNVDLIIVSDEILAKEKYRELFEGKILITTNLKWNNYKAEKLVEGKVDFKSDPMLPEDTAMILLTSGTTDMSKGVMLSNCNIISNIKAISSYINLRNEDKILILKNLSHASTFIGEMLVGIFNGCTLYRTEKILTSKIIIDEIYKNQITVFFAVPSLMSLLMDKSYSEIYKLNSLRIINIYGTKIDFSFVEKFANTFKNINIIYSYGLTEASPRVSYIYIDKWREKQFSSGVGINDIKIIIKETDENSLSEEHVFGTAVEDLL